MGTVFALALIGGSIIFYCLTGKKTQKIALCFAVSFSLLIFFGYRSPEDYTDETKFSREYISHLSSRGITLAQAGIKLSEKSKLENGGDFLAILSVMTLFFGMVVCTDFLQGDENKIYIKQIAKKCLVLLIATVWYLLSLYAGLELFLLPWLKKKSRKSDEPVLITA